MKSPRREIGVGLCLWLILGIGTSAAAQVSATPSSTPAAISATGSTAVSASNSAKPATPVLDASSSLPDAPSAVAFNMQQQDPPPPSTAVQSTPPPPRTPTNATVGPTFLLANGMLLGSTILNAEVISRCRPDACQSVPDGIRHRGTLYGIGIPSSLAVTYISYRLKKSGTRMWILPVAVLTAGNIIYAAHAAQYSNSSSAAHSAVRKP